MARRAWRPNSTRWQIADPHPDAEALARQLHTDPLVAQVLANRGLHDANAARAFLTPRYADLHDPTMLPGAVEAAGRIARAVADGRRIVIYGDYDVDGITGVAQLLTCLRMAGAEPGYYVPHRLEEGYGLNSAAVAKLAADGATMLVTVDCGIAGAEPVAEARAAGLEVIVTDHHAPPDQLPPADVIVHPAMNDRTYPNPHLAGSGVAFKLVWQIAREICGRQRVDEAWRTFLMDATGLAALGTIADVVPLVDENRTLATFGLRSVPATQHPGLRALLRAGKLDGENLDAYHVGFVLGPRLNACGRMGHARLAVELLTDVAPARAAKIAAYLTEQNTARRRAERNIADEAVALVESQNLADDEHRAIVLASENWHSGVIGIVASRLVQRFARPAVLIALGDDGGQGSARSIPGYPMRDALAACSEHLVSFGGHAMAAGLRIAPDKVDAFGEALRAHAREHIAVEQLTPAVRIDVETQLAHLTFPVARRLADLAPFGQGNPRPIVALRDCEVIRPPRRMGRGGGTAGLTLGQNGTAVRAVGFGMGDLADLLEGVTRVDVAAEVTLNTFNGRTNVELKLRDVRW
ncbi:MAG: single-stranded-DNA-specific exonuclease RecJ [Phycisphaerae bacterium]|nr:single-stranded-DNA-specific exonuclease RecJ [Phycisphaerae bacterium]